MNVKSSANFLMISRSDTGAFLLPWINNDAGGGVRERRLLEKVWRRSSGTQDQGSGHNGKGNNTIWEYCAIPTSSTNSSLTRVHIGIAWEIK